MAGGKCPARQFPRGSRALRRLATATTLLLATGVAIAQPQRALPYWASLSAGDALLRTGPGREYPSTWRYRRVDLPLKVIGSQGGWLKVIDFEDDTGDLSWWMHGVFA